MSGRKGAPRASDLDRRIGLRLRELRLRDGWTQEELAEAVGVTYQQLHKYENGINRISAGRLLAMAEFLEVEPAELLALPDRPFLPPGEGLLRQRTATELFRRLEPEQQLAVVALLRVMAG